jgi:hypothetical protein
MSCPAKLLLTKNQNAQRLENYVSARRDADDIRAHLVDIATEAGCPVGVLAKHWRTILADDLTGQEID